MKRCASDFFSGGGAAAAGSASAMSAPPARQARHGLLEETARGVGEDGAGPGARVVGLLRAHGGDDGATERRLYLARRPARRRGQALPLLERALDEPLGREHLVDEIEVDRLV